MAQEDEQSEKTRNFLEEEHALSMEYATPHTDWAVPYAGGTTRVVFFTTWFQGSTEAREVIELMQRFDLDAKAVYSAQGSHLIGDGNPAWYGGDPEAGTKRALQLLEVECDAVFVNQLAADKFPKPIQDRLRQRVVEGTGLVVVGGGLPFEGAACVAPSPKNVMPGQAYTLGRGRIAILPSREKLSPQIGWETAFDYQMEKEGRALLWAARHEPAADLSLTVASNKINRAELPSAIAVLSWKDMPPGTELSAALRRQDGIKWTLGAWKAAGMETLPLTLPPVPEGDYHLDVIAARSGLVEDWSTTSLKVTADKHVASIALDKYWAEVGGAFCGRVFVSKGGDGNERIEVRLVDKHGRILARETARSSEKGMPFSFSVKPWMPMLMQLDALLLNDGEEIASASIFLRVAKRHRDQFHFMMWNTPSGDLAPFGVKSLGEHGVSLVLQGGDPPLSFAENEISYVPYAQSFRASSHTVTAMLDPDTGWLKTGCVHDDATMGEAVEKAVKAMQGSREQGVFAYSLGDENAVRASCLSPHCIKAYRSYLEQAYGRIGALNEEWNTEYKDFNQIELLTDGDLPAGDAPRWFKDYFADRQQLHRTDSEGAEGDDLDRQIALGDINDEIRALQAGNFARWYDRQAFQNQGYMDWCKRFREAFKRMDPQAWTGFEGTDSFTIRKFTTRSRQGGDLDLFVRDMDYFGPYEGPANEVVRSVARPGFPTGNWIGYEPGAETLLRQYWGQVTDCMNTIQWWRYDNLDGYHGYLLPTLAPFPAVKELLEDTQVVRDGLGSLLMRCRMEDDGIAMLYSMPSTYIAHFDGNETYGDYRRDHCAWHRLLHDAGLQFRYVTDRMLRQGEFEAAGHKVLILPLAFAMGPAEAEAVRGFVRKGGTVIADVRPGIYDGHCKPMAKGLLDELFGIERADRQDSKAVDRLAVSGEVNGQPVSMRWGNWHGRDVYPQMRVDPSVSITSGKAMGEAFHIHYWSGLKTPVCIVNEYGQGRAILLNFSVFEAPVDALVSGVLRACGVLPAIAVDKADGGGHKGIEITRWTNGKEGLFALLGNYTGAVAVTMPDARFVYDIKAHVCLGQTASFTTAMKANRASFFTLSEREISAPDVKMKGSVRRGEPLKVTVSLPHSCGNHAVLLRGATPEGKDAEWFHTTIITRQEPSTITVPIAWNEVVGGWKIVATELFSGEQSQACLEVR